MVNKSAHSYTPKHTEGSRDVNVMTEICAAMDELYRHNQTLEDDILNIQHYLQETSPPKEMEILDPRPVSDKI